MRKVSSIVGITSLILILVPLSVMATSKTFTDVFGSKAVFDVVDGNLVVTLSTDRIPSNNSEVLTAFFFRGPVLTPFSATVPNNQNRIFWPTTLEDLNSNLNVAGEWTYKTGLSGMLPGGGNQGISSAGFGLFGPPDLFPGGSDLNPNTPGPGGGDYGLTNGNSVTSVGYGVLIKNTTVFIFEGITRDFDPSQEITDGFFQYGTTLSDNTVPEPATMLLLGSGLIGLAGFARRKFRK